MSPYDLSHLDYYEDAITKQDGNETELAEDDISESVYEYDLRSDDKFKYQIKNKVFQNSNNNNKTSPTTTKEDNTSSTEADEK